MSITKSYNKQNDTYYAYDTQYIYDEAKQRKVQKRRCIGKIDPVTNEVVPTGKRGRPQKEVLKKPKAKDMPKIDTNDMIIQGLSKLSSRLNTIEDMMSGLTSELNSARNDYDELMRNLSNDL